MNSNHAVDLSIDLTEAMGKCVVNLEIQWRLVKWIFCLIKKFYMNFRLQTKSFRTWFVGSLSVFISARFSGLS